MNSILRKLTMISALVLVIVGTAISVGRPQSVSEPGLGAEWQCSRTAFFITICAHGQTVPDSRGSAAALAEVGIDKNLAASARRFAKFTDAEFDQSAFAIFDF
jgi:hypothetical protein